MNNICNIVRDLLPIYNDNLCSKDSKEFIEKHLNNCDSCKQYYYQLKEDLFYSPQIKSEDQIQSKSFKKLKKHFFRKNILVSILSITAVLLLITFIRQFQIPIKYQPDLFTINQAEDTVIDIKFSKSDYYKANAMFKKIKKDGEMINVAYIYFNDNIWTKYFTHSEHTSIQQFSIGERIMADYGGHGNTIEHEGNIKAIYYLIGNYKKLNDMSQENFSKVAEKAILIWEEKD
jgi:hypothetical protein